MFHVERTVAAFVCGNFTLFHVEPILPLVSHDSNWTQVPRECSTWNNVEAE